jgi:Gpi18-like mannosyltransferase
MLVLALVFAFTFPSLMFHECMHGVSLFVVVVVLGLLLFANKISIFAQQQQSFLVLVRSNNRPTTPTEQQF